MSRARDFANLAGSADAGGITGKNLIINGAMQVAQRGTSFTGSSEYTLDRFYFNRLNTDQLACTVTQDSDAPDGFYNSLKVEVTTAETTLDSDEFTRVFHRFEGQNLQHLQYGTSSAKSVTLSFWVKASVTGDYAVLFYRDLATDRSITKTYTINSANTWEYKTIAIDGDQTTATPSDNVTRFEIDWALAAGTDWTSTDGTSWGTYVSGKFAYGQTANLIGTANATWHITGIQLEVGEQATPFEHRSYGDELARCQRYFQIIPSNSAAYSFPLVRHRSATNSYSGSSYYPVTMRANATMTLDTSGSWIHKPNTRQDTGSATIVSSSSSVFTVVATPSTDDSTQYLAFSNNNVEADAEL